VDVDSEQKNATAWTAYGTHHLQRGTLVPDPERLDFGFWGTGPGLEFLGDIADRRVLDLGCGMGKFAALVARERGALIDAVDSSPTQHQRAVTRYGGQRGLRRRSVGETAPAGDSVVPGDEAAAAVRPLSGPYRH
jgi:SAM-dependent methyltransferase